MTNTTAGTTAGNTDLASLIAAVTREAKGVIERELDVLRSELKDELAKGRTAAVNLGAGAVMGALGGILLSFMLVHLVQRSTGIPFWLSYGTVGGLLALGGSGLIAAGAEQASEIDLMPKEAGEAVKESLSSARSSVQAGV